MDAAQFNPTHEEFFNAMNQMYPTETARVVAEIRSAKMEAYITNEASENGSKASENGDKDSSSKNKPAKKATAKKGK